MLRKKYWWKFANYFFNSIVITSRVTNSLFKEGTKSKVCKQSHKSQIDEYNIANNFNRVNLKGCLEMINQNWCVILTYFLFPCYTLHVQLVFDCDKYTRNLVLFIHVWSKVHVPNLLSKYIRAPRPCWFNRDLIFTL